EGVPVALAQTWPDTTRREAGLRLPGPRELCPGCQVSAACGFRPMHPLTGLRGCLKIFNGVGYPRCRRMGEDDRRVAFTAIPARVRRPQEPPQGRILWHVFGTAT